MIKITRGDTKVLKFQRKNNEGVIQEEADEMFFTVKPNAYLEDYIFQKKLNVGITFDDSDYYYRVTILPSDTNGLYYGTYKYDIEVKNGDNYVRTIDKGDFIVGKEVTFPGNEEGVIG